MKVKALGFMFLCTALTLEITGNGNMKTFFKENYQAFLIE